MLHYTHSSRQSGNFCQSTAWKWRFKEENEFFVSLAKGIKLQKFNDSLWFMLWYIWVLQNGFKSTGFCDVLLYITVQMYQSSCMLAGTVISALHWGLPCPLVDFCINMHHPVLISSLWMYLFLWNVLRCSSEENQKYRTFKKNGRNALTKELDHILQLRALYVFPLLWCWAGTLNFLQFNRRPLEITFRFSSHPSVDLFKRLPQ